MRELFDIISCENGEARAQDARQYPRQGLFEVRLNTAHPIFDGHFPERPVLPGVCSLMITRECASHLAGRSLKYRTVRESKFLAAIAPETSLTVAVDLAEDYNMNAKIYADQTVMLKLKATLTADE